MGKNSWSNPELKELSIENTLQQPTPYAFWDAWVCTECGAIRHEVAGPPKYCFNCDDWRTFTRKNCES